MLKYSDFTTGRGAWLTLLSGGVLLVSTVTVLAQGTNSAPPSISSETTSVLVQRTKDMIKEDRPAELIPLLRELLVRLTGNNDESAMETRAFCMYQIGVCQMQIGQYVEAVKSLDDFIRAFPQDRQVASASLLVAECYARSKDWPAAERYARSQMANKTIDPARRMSALQILAEALYRQEKWAEVAEPLKEIFKLEKDQRLRNSAAIMLMTAYSKAKDAEGFMAFLNQCDASVLQNAGVNAALVEIGDEKRKSEAFAEALVLYRSVLLKDELIALYEKQVAEINAFLAKPYSASVGSSRSTYEESVKRRKAEMEGKSRAIEQLKSSPGYDMDILLRVGRCYADMQRKWPAYAVFRRMYKSAPDHALAEDARFQSFMIAAEMDRLEEAVQEGTSYMARHPSGKFLDEVSLNLMQVYLKANKLDLAEAAGFKALDLSPNHRFVDQVKYLLGYIYFQKMDYADALALFQEVLERWPQGTYREAADYWIAMSHLFLGQYESAVTAFSEYLNNPVYAQTGRFAEDAAYRLGVAQYGAGKYAESEGTFRRFIEKYPASDLRSEAYSMVGDLRGAEGDLDVALSYYAMGRDAAGDNIAQINYAVFQAASVYELLGRHSEIIILMEGYLQKHGEKGNYAGAGFWIGKAYTAMGQREKALQKYIETVVRFGDKPENDQVDLIIRELIKEHDSEGGWAGRVEIKKQLESRLAEARAQKQTTLALRLATLFANITIGTERQRYVDEILAENNVKEAGAITLLLIAGEAARRGDADLVHRTYQHCLEAYPESDILVDVMNTELLMLFEKGEYQKVADLAEEITLKFGYRTEVGLTRKLKADALRLSGKYSEAFVTYQELFAVRDWRGPMTVEALYWMGYCNFQQGKTEEAFTFFQRLYVLYEKQTEWAAKSYEAAILCHEKLGRTEDVIRTCDEMLANPRIAATPEGQRAKERLAVLRPEGGRK